jgi:cation diffusion facilitator CzcD-associated flavoprotein CzcO
VAARSLARRGIPFECLDRSERIGGGSGMWPIGVSRERLELRDWPMPRSYPRFPRRSQLAAYLRDYAERFGLRESIRLRTEVVSARPIADGSWELTLRGGERRRYRALVVTGEHRSEPDAGAPRPPGRFAGEQLRVSDCGDLSRLRDRDVVVAGGGAAAAELAVEASYLARSTCLSIRTPRYVMPLTVAGRPYDQVPGLRQLLGEPPRLPLPRRLRHGLLTLAYRTWVSPGLHGLPAPRPSADGVRAIVAPRLLERLLHGRIAVEAEIERFDGRWVHYAGGGRRTADAIVWSAERRHTDLRFLPADLAPRRGDGRELIEGVFAPGARNLAFVGLAAPPIGSPVRGAERQAERLAERLAAGRTRRASGRAP